MITHLDADHLERLSTGRVGIAGAGGLGSNCAMALARAGVGHLVVLDMDAVERSNLNRQAFTVDQVGRPKVEALRDNLHAAAPDCRVRAVHLRYRQGMAAELFGSCQVVVEAFDDPRAKADLIEDVLDNLSVPIVAGSGLAGIGGNDALQTTRFGRLWVVGDGQTAVGPGVALLAPRVVAVAAMQANQALELLLDPPEPLR